jgi:hypothetical protein
MSVFEAVFLTVEGSEEREIEFRPLSGGTVDEASAEALDLTAPKGANLIKILKEGHLVRRIGINL